MKTPKIQTPIDSKAAENKLYAAIASIQSAEEARQFFHDLCTPNEIQAMADRWRVVALIKAGKPYREIYQATGVSVTTIGRVARCMMMGEGGYNRIYDRVEKKYDEISKAKNRRAKIRALK